MNSGVVIICISIAVISLIIYIIKNKQGFNKKYNEIKNKKIVKILFYIVVIFACIFYIMLNHLVLSCFESIILEIIALIYQFSL